MKRRDFLAGAGAGVAAGLSGVPAAAQGAPEIGGPFAPVKSSMDRVIRSIVGLRPYRKTGFRLEAVRQGRRTIIHNYGHGGGGVSLSWGCAELAAEMARQTRRSEIAILGAGVMGLTTARVLQKAGAEVTIYAEAMPPDTTSNVAGALWYPTTLVDRDKVTPEFQSLLDHTSRVSFLRFQTFANDPRYGVFWIRHHQLRSNPPSQARPLPGGDALYPGLRKGQSGEGPFGYAHWSAYYTLMIDPDIYLRALVMDFLAAGGKLVSRRFETDRDVNRLDQRTIVNCTGLGAATLFGDEDLIPVRGQLSLLLPQPEINYGYATSLHGGTIYMFPRKSSIILGGSGDRDDYSLEVRPEEVKRMVEGHAELAARL